MNYNEKIEKINKDRILILDMIKEKSQKDKEFLSSNMNDVVNMLEFEGKNYDEYKAIIKSKDLILELTEEIQNTTNIEDIKKLRKKINYLVSKIKKEIEKRNINEIVLEKMYNDVAYLRKDISIYLSYLKREKNLNEIKKLYENIDNLSKDDLNKLKNKLNNEIKYNKNSIQRINDIKSSKEKRYDNTSNELKVIEKELKNNNISKIEEKQNNNIIEEIIKELSDIKEANKDADEPVTNILKSLYTEIEVLSKSSNETDNNIIEDETINAIKQLNNNTKVNDVSLSDRINSYRKQYNFKELKRYDKSIFSNCINLLKNIPRYNWNKKVTKVVETDYKKYYRGRDLIGYIEYSKKRNSIKTALAKIFNNSKLSEREAECLYNHDNCVEWITEFYNQNNQVMKLQR